MHAHKYSHTDEEIITLNVLVNMNVIVQEPITDLANPSSTEGLSPYTLSLYQIGQNKLGQLVDLWGNKASVAKFGGSRELKEGTLTTSIF